MRNCIGTSRKCLKLNDGDKADPDKPVNPKAMRALENLLSQIIDKKQLVDVGVGNFDTSWFKVLKTPRAWLEDWVNQNL